MSVRELVEFVGQAAIDVPDELKPIFAVEIETVIRRFLQGEEPGAVTVRMFSWPVVRLTVASNSLVVGLTLWVTIAALAVGVFDCGKQLLRLGGFVCE